METWTSRLRSRMSWISVLTWILMDYFLYILFQLNCISLFNFSEKWMVKFVLSNIVQPTGRLPVWQVETQLFASPFVSRSYMALWLPERFWCKPPNGQLVPKSLTSQMAGNHHSAHIHAWGENSNVNKLHIVEKENLSGLTLS